MLSSQNPYQTRFLLYCGNRRTFARQATEEEDPEKMIALVERIIEAYDAEKRREKNIQ